MWSPGTLFALTFLLVAAERCYAQPDCLDGWKKFPRSMTDEEFRQVPQYVINSLPQFVQHPTGGTVIEGHLVSLSCAVDVSAPALQLVWTVNDTEIVECPKSNYSVVFNESGTSSTLSISHFSASMEGRYQCIAKNGNYTVVSNSARIVRPAFFGWLDPSPQDPTRIVKNGSSTLLVCNPNATAAVYLISWKIGGNLSNNNSSALLVRYSDLGSVEQTYFCDVTFADNLLQQTRTFSIKPSLEQPSNTPLQFTLTPANATAPIGGNITLFCVAEGTPEPTISWLKDGTPLTGQDTPGSVLTLHKATLEMSGEYACIASSGGASVTSSTAVVRIQGPPGDCAIQTSRYDQNRSDIFLRLLPTDTKPTVVLNCTVQSAEGAEFRWLFRGRPASAYDFVQANGQQLWMSAPSISELVGSVQCWVLTTAGVSFASARLLIADKPNYPQSYAYSRSYFSYNFSWVPPITVATVPRVVGYVVQILFWQQNFTVCERETSVNSLTLDAISFEDERVMTRVAAKTERGVLSDFVPDSGISFSRVQPPPPSDLQSNISESYLGYHVSLSWKLPSSTIYPDTSYSVGIGLQCTGTSPLLVQQNDLTREPRMVYTTNISCCSNCSWSVLLTPVTTEPVVSTASSSFETGSIAFSTPPTLNSLKWCGTNGTSFTLNITLPAATELCHCSGPLFINVSYTNNSSTFYTELPLQEYQTGVSIYSLTVEKATECWRSYNVSVAYRSHTRVSRFSSPATLEGSEITIELKPLDAVNCLLATKMGTVRLSYYQHNEVANQTVVWHQVDVSSPHLVLGGLMSNATMSAIASITVGGRSRTLGITVYVEPPAVTMATSTGDLEATSLAEKGMIVGIVTGVCVIVVVAFIVVAVFVCMCAARRYLKSRSRQQQRDEDTEIIVQTILQPDSTDLVDTDCRSITSTEATHCDRMTEYLKDVDDYSKGTPDGGVDSGLMEDLLAPRSDDLQSVTDDKDVGIGLNRTGSLLSSQLSDAMELENLGPDPNERSDDGCSLYAKTETRPLLENSPPPKSKVRVYQGSRTKVLREKGGKLRGGTDNRVKPESSLLTSQYMDLIGSRTQHRGNTGDRPPGSEDRTIRESRIPHGDSRGGTSRGDIGHRIPQGELPSFTSGESRNSGCFMTGAGGGQLITSQGYIHNSPSASYTGPRNPPLADVRSSLTGMGGQGRPTNSPTSMGYVGQGNPAINMDHYAVQVNRHGYVRESQQYNGTRALYHNKDSGSDGLAGQWEETWDAQGTQPPCNHVEPPHDQDHDPAATIRRSCYGHTSSSSSSLCRDDDSPPPNHRHLPPNNLVHSYQCPQSCDRPVFQGSSNPSSNGMTSPHGGLEYHGSTTTTTAAAGSHCVSGHHNPDRRYISTAGPNPAGYHSADGPLNGAGPHNGDMVYHSIIMPCGSSMGEGGHRTAAGQHNGAQCGGGSGNGGGGGCGGQYRSTWPTASPHDGRPTDGHPRVCCTGTSQVHTRRLAQSGRMVSPHDHMGPAGSQMDITGHKPFPPVYKTCRGSSQVTSDDYVTELSSCNHNSHVTSRSGYISEIQSKQQHHKCNAPFDNSNHCCHPQSYSRPQINTVPGAKHQSQVKTPPGPRHPVQQPQQADDLRNVMVVIPLSPTYPIPPVPPSSCPPSQTAPVKNGGGDGGCVEGVPIARANCGMMQNPHNPAEKLNAMALDYVTLLPADHMSSSTDDGTVPFCIEDLGDLGPSTAIEGTYTKAESSYYKVEEIPHSLLHISDSPFNGQGLTKNPCIPSLLGQRK